MLGPMPLLRDLLRAALRPFCPTPCEGCGDPRGPVCPACRRELRELPLLLEPASAGLPPAVFLGEYRGLLRRLILAAKLGRCPGVAMELAETLGARMEVGWPLSPLPGALLAPPVAPGREDFHPGRVLARLLSRNLGIPLLRGVILRRDGEGYGRHLGREARASGVARRFLGGGPAPPGPVWIVDDLVTTGATVRRLTQLLRFRGGRVLGVVGLARTRRRKRS